MRRGRGGKSREKRGARRKGWERETEIETEERMREREEGWRGRRGEREGERAAGDT